jgi:hypothetical protein
MQDFVDYYAILFVHGGEAALGGVEAWIGRLDTPIQARNIQGTFSEHSVNIQ